ncbi:peptidase M23 [Tenacibaculum todarodis]|uniref:Peptidase M23 n=1 Tax=Tenacibaculum todarodis TaxID=1850252 RepID=A0A1L3JH89_9FLAO|nr:peptidoglycan DD-metalloendopeptidase family protein [Tenacibaculum todarodis]APG64433.1 peptidase M23 [Tenacibaculum todarodis]
MEINSFLTKLSASPLRVIDASISLNEYVPISISSKNKDLNFDVSSSSEWETYLSNFLKENTAKVAFGGYLEERDIYNRSGYFNSEENQRNIHLGIDLWCNAKTNVLAVLDGEIHSFKNNNNFGDYGPTIILKHKVEDVTFYSLYGHLSTESIQNIKIGNNVKAGEKIAALGNSTVNGDYAPHLHFQLILNMEDYSGDYPGVSSKEKLPFYKQNCPNPNSLLKLPNEI